MDSKLVLGLLNTSPVTDGPVMSEDARRWLPDAVWARLLGLQRFLGPLFPVFADLSESIKVDGGDWEDWYNQNTPENVRAPGRLSVASELEKIVLLRAMRPDRVPDAMKSFITSALGEGFVQTPVYDIRRTYDQSCKSTPIFFVLFPGVDPAPWIEDLGSTLGITQANGNYTSISMGQGQEQAAENALDKVAAAGGWVLLQNVHLVQKWLPTLERKLEELGDKAENRFRCFISAEPPALGSMKNMPECLLQSSIKV